MKIRIKLARITDIRGRVWRPCCLDCARLVKQYPAAVEHRLSDAPWDRNEWTVAIPPKFGPSVEIQAMRVRMVNMIRERGEEAATV